MKYTFVFILFLSFFVLVTPVSAQEDMEVTIVPSVTATPAPQSEYTLPYPGLLPDNPFYWLKATRDKVVSVLIGDPIKKAEFDLLQSDKRFNAAVFLLKNDSKKEILAITTVSKAENYYEEGINRAMEAKKEGRDVSGIGKNMADAAEKYTQIFQRMEKQVKIEKKDLSIQMKRMEGLAKRANQLSPKK